MSTKVSVGILVVVIGLGFLALSTGQVYAYYSRGSYYRGGYYGGYYRRGYGYGWGSSYYYYPYYSGYYGAYYPYYAYPYCSYYYGYYGSYCGSYYGYSGAYPYSYGYGYGNYGYNQQYQLTLNTNPSSLSNAVTGGGQFTQGTSATFSANQNIVQVSQDTRYVFSGWTGDYTGSSQSGSVTMDAAKSVTAQYQLQYYLSLSSQPSNAPQLQGSGWFNSGTSTVISIPSQVVPVNSGSQLAFSGWSVDGSPSQTGSALTVQMSGPHTVVAQYTQQYYLTVSSNQGTVSGAGWYNAGSYAQISASTPSSPGYGVSMVFNGWQGDVQSSSQSTTVLMNGPMSVTATWGTDPTVLYVTIALVIVAVAAVAAISAVAWSRRKETQWRTTQPQYVQPTQTQNVAPIAAAPTVNPNYSNTNLNQTSDAQPTGHSTAHRQRRHRSASPSPQPSNPDESNASGTEGQT